MGLIDWLKRTFAPDPAAPGAEDPASLRAEYGKAADEALEADDPPSEPAP
jgi:hypothetical protein